MMQAFKLLGDKLTLLILINFCLLCGLIENYYPNWIIVSVITINQIYEGVISLIVCLIPQYEEEKDKWNKRRSWQGNIVN